MSELEILQTEIDRLVDGEATADEQQALLRRLDETDDGWRCLALGFVEAQTWGTELRSLGEAAEPQKVLPAVDTTAAESPKQTSRSPGWATVALTAAVMLVAGLLVGMELRVNPEREGGLFADSTGQSSSAEIDESAENNDGFPISPDESGPGNARPQTEFVELVLNEEPGLARTVSVPIHSDGNLDRVLNASESILSPGVHEILDNRGHQLFEERGLIPVELPDGRLAVIPVRQVQLRHMLNRFGQ